MKKGAKKTSRTTTAAKAAPTNTWMIADKAIKELERGVTHLHKQRYSEALSNFKSIVDGYPDEMELLDRIKVYVKICETHLERKPAVPKDPNDLFYLGVIKANEAEYEEAVGFLDKALQSSPGDEKIHYVLASTLALKGERDRAVEHLQKAIELNGVNKIHARNDPDFEPLRDDDTVQNMLYPEEA